MLPLMSFLLVVGCVLLYLLSFLIPGFWSDAEESPFAGLSPKAARRVRMVLIVFVVVLAGVTFLGIQYDRLQNQSDAAANPTPIIHISSAEAQAITTNFTQMCDHLTLGDLQAVFDDLTPTLQQQVGTTTQVPVAIGGTFKGGTSGAAYCRPEDQLCGNPLSGVFVDILASADANHAQLCGEVSPDPSVAGPDTFNIRSFAYVRTEAGWKIDGVQTVWQNSGSSTG